jgi:hypothetical protein
VGQLARILPEFVKGIAHSFTLRPPPIHTPWGLHPIAIIQQR